MRVGMRAVRSARMERWGIVAGLLVFALLWLPLLDRGALAPPTDNIEQLTWVRSLEWGYYKHPPLPTWLLWPLVRVLGWSAWATYFAGALCTLGAFALLWCVLRELRGRAYAMVALLAGLCVTFYNGRLYFYNHEIVLIPLAVGCAVACWKAYATRRIGWWIVLGVCLGLGALAKYQIVVAGVAVLVFWLSQRGWRDPMQVFGLQVAGLTALAVFSPHLIWLAANDFESLGYAMTSSLAASLSWPARAQEVARWWGDQMLNRAMPAWVLLGVFWMLARRRRSMLAADAAAPGPASAPVARDPGRALLLAFGFTPLVFVSCNDTGHWFPHPAALGNAVSAVCGAGSDGTAAGSRRVAVCQAAGSLGGLRADPVGADGADGTDLALGGGTGAAAGRLAVLRFPGAGPDPAQTGDACLGRTGTGDIGAAGRSRRAGVALARTAAGADRRAGAPQPLGTSRAGGCMRRTGAEPEHAPRGL